MPQAPAPASTTPPKRRQHRLAAALAIVAALLLAFLLVHWLRKPKPKPPAPARIGVATTTVAVGDLDVYLDALGTVTPVYTATIVSRVAGEVTQVQFKEGQMVRKNDLLALVDPRPYTAALMQAQGQLARDQAALKNARIDLVRYQNAYKLHAVSQQQVATQQATVDQDEGTVQLDRGNLAAAQINVDYTRIVAPIDGRIGLRNIDPGNVVAANGPNGVCVITQIKPITVIFTIAEDEIAAVTAQTATGRTLPVQALDRTKQHKLADGVLLTLDNQVNTATGTVRARASFANQHDELFPNQFVNTRLLIKTLTRADLVPQAAVQHNNEAAFVYVVGGDGKVALRNVQILATEGQTVAVTGVVAGEVLVTDGFDKLQDGTKVVVRPQSAPGGRAAKPAG
jgi:multidrug efflux system membrane fusion protein